MATGLLQLLRSSAPELPTRLLPHVVSRGFNQYEAVNGPSPLQVDVAREWYQRQRSAMTLGNRYPSLPDDLWIAPNAVIVGDVDFHNYVSGGARVARWVLSSLRSIADHQRRGHRCRAVACDAFVLGMQLVCAGQAYLSPVS